MANSESYMPPLCVFAVPYPDKKTVVMATNAVVDLHIISRVSLCFEVDSIDFF